MLQSGYGFTVAFTVTPNDTTQLNLSGFMCGTTAGNITYLDMNGVSHVCVAPVGAILPVPASVIMATGTTAVGIVGFQ